MNRQEQLESIATTYTLTELQPVLGVTYRTLLQYIKEGKLAAVKIGGIWRISADNLKAFVDGRKADK
ncbi:MAG: helix-turn-helix domain-containing protein [Ruminococcus sp.]|nr:helix-turn-helix domain-containing protein [Ruminococcus sp.]